MTQIDSRGRAPLLAGRVRNFLVALVACIALIKIVNPEPSSFGFGTILGIVAMVAMVGYLVNVYLLSRALDPKAAVAWLMLALQLLPIIGVPVAISMIIKASRLSQNTARAEQSARQAAGDS